MTTKSQQLHSDENTYHVGHYHNKHVGSALSTSIYWLHYRCHYKHYIYIIISTTYLSYYIIFRDNL